MSALDLAWKSIPFAVAFFAFGCMYDPQTDVLPDELDEEVAEAGEAICGGRIIKNVAALPGTFHWENPAHLLGASEGGGPRDLYVSVSTSVTAEVSVTGTAKPKDSDLSASLGFNVSKEFSLEASSSILVPAFGYARLEAYPLYKRIGWDIVLDKCGRGVDVVLGSGIVYKPIGVYFATSGVECVPAGDGYGCATGGAGGNP